MDMTNVQINTEYILLNLKQASNTRVRKNISRAIYLKPITPPYIIYHMAQICVVVVYLQKLKENETHKL